MVLQKIKSFLFNFFHFNKQERNGVLVLCIIISILIAFRVALPFINTTDKNVQFITIQPATTDTLVETADKFVNESTKNASQPLQTSNQLFVFNPNTVSQSDAMKLGFSEKLSTTLVKFREKGGKFYKPEDLKKLYGLSNALYERLESYILIPNQQKAYKADSVYVKPVFENKKYTKMLVELNSADSLSIVYLKGIGPGFTKRIIKYRTMLGGFHSVNQLKEVYGMTDSTYAVLSSQITIDANSITKIPINVIDFNSLRKHPYFNFQSAQAIINFRFKHGKLSEGNIKELGIFSDEKLRLILPYLSY